MLSSTNNAKGTKQQNNTEKTFMWWNCLRNISITNMLLWFWTYQIHKNSELEHRTYSQICLSAVYVLVCAYRSIYPRVDLERYCLFDSHLSSIFLGRLAATIAEICYSYQFALLLSQLAEIFEGKEIIWLIKITSDFLVPMITVAQLCCWRAVLTLDFRWHIIEESIWAIASFLIFSSFCSVIMIALNQVRCCCQDDVIFISITGSIFSIAYLGFMVVLDIPMYINKQKENRAKRIHGSKQNGRCTNIWSQRKTTEDWKVWREEAPWLTGYFSLAVWISISLIHVSVSLQNCLVEKNTLYNDLN